MPELLGAAPLELPGGELLELLPTTLDDGELLLGPLEDRPLLLGPLDDGRLLLGSPEDGALLLTSLDEGALLLGPLEDGSDEDGADDDPLPLQLEDPEEEPLDELLTFDELEQQSQQQQPAWWLKAQGPSYRVSVDPDRQIDTARV